MDNEIEIPSKFPAAGDVRDKGVVITGAGRGLGRLLAHAFSHAGANVTLVSRTDSDLEALAGELPGPAQVLAGDVTDEVFVEGVADVAAQMWGRLDGWIANAGISPVLAPARDTDPKVWRDVLEVNLTASFLGARAAARVMAEGGRIVFTGSVLGERPAHGLSAYSASKAAVVALAKTLAIELAPQNVTVNVVAPGWFDSPLVEGYKRNPALEASVLEHTAQKRWGAATDLAGAYQFLISDAAAFVTGTVISVDGGYLLT